jgi:hypothetical protein
VQFTFLPQGVKLVDISGVKAEVNDKLIRLKETVKGRILGTCSDA